MDLSLILIIKYQRWGESAVHAEDRAVEAVLFSAGRPLGINEIHEATGIASATVRNVLEKLITEYEERETAIEVAKVGEKYAMQIKSDYAEYAVKLAQMEIPVKVLKTAALIAYHQPIRQSKLQEMVGAKVYEHVRKLHELGLIRTRSAGRTLILSTTPRFAEYFGIATTDVHEIKKWLARRVHGRSCSNSQ